MPEPRRPPTQVRSPPDPRARAPKPLPSDGLELAIAELVAAARKLQLASPDSEGLTRLPATRLELVVDPSATAAMAEQVRRTLAAEVRDAAHRERAVIAGSALCLRCGDALCDHASPPSPRQVFAGWSPSGKPEWLDFGQLLVDRGDPRIDRLFGASGSGGSTVLAFTQRPHELEARLLPAFRPSPALPRLLGQVSAGWFRVAGIDGTIALTLQLLSTGHRAQRRIFLHPVVDRELQERWGELDSPPWGDALRLAREEVAGLERLARTPHTSWASVVNRIESVLGGLAAALERPEKARLRRTAHAEARRAIGRPVATAVADLVDCPVERFLRDAGRNTWIVAGPKGRTHVFADDGRHVTSVRYGPDTLERRIATGRWKPGTAAERDALVERARGLGQAE